MEILILTGAVIIMVLLCLIMFAFVFFGPAAPAKVGIMADDIRAIRTRIDKSDAVLNKMVKGFKNYSVSFKEQQLNNKALMEEVKTLNIQLTKLTENHYKLEQELVRRHGLDPNYKHK